ncbi:MAG: SpoIIE family protein phosphatase [Planctomycetes bacterium]|nr:SpoIIE family protein phosphatase [Planctomycetota bacterium]
MAVLVLLHQGEATPHELLDDETVVGRHPDCGIQLQSNMVSRRHARVLKDGLRYLIEDMGSGNGTLVNGKQIDSRISLKHGDRIKLGPVLLRFELKTPAEMAAAESSSSSDRSTVAFPLDIASGENDTATISEALDSSTVFGMLDVRPEAKLKGILEISRNLAGTVDLDSMLPKVLDTLFEIFPYADRGSILLRDEQTDRMIPEVQKHRRLGEDQTVTLSRTILNKVLEEKTGILSADAASDSRFEASESISNLTIRSMMCVPMLGLDGEPLGLINIDTQNPLNRFNKEDLELLLAVAGQAALSYENVRLMASHLEKEKYENEMRIAWNVQRALLPSELPKVEGYEFFAAYEAAQAVGGDYYDCFLMDDDKICISFGDVAGKGVPASLVMSRIASVVQSTMQHVSDVRKAAAAINLHMCNKAVGGRFVTYVLIVIDLKTHEMTGVIAGHMAPLIRTVNGDVEEFGTETIGIPIGVLEDYAYETAVRTIQPGETVVIYTDGVSEAMNPQGELYGMNAVGDFVKQGSSNATQLGQSLLDDVRRHANGRPQNDDIAILTFGRNPE